MKLDHVRIDASAKPDQQKKELGQFMTSPSIAQFMAGLFTPKWHDSTHLLDPGAGMGSLSAAFLDRWASGDVCSNQVSVTAYEIDDSLREHLTRTFKDYSSRMCLSTKILSDDFIENAVVQITAGKTSWFTHAILNPPYKKINSKSKHRLLLRQVGIETVNLYSAFVALSLTLLAPGGQLVAIIPRSFCNGPYYRPFRKILLHGAAIRQIHLFKSRELAFKDDNVLQENIIIVLEKNGRQGDITVSTSTDGSFSDYSALVQPFNQVVRPDDSDFFIRIPSSPPTNDFDISPTIHYTLNDLGLEVSTGPVVDFRLIDHIRRNPELGDVPLLYPRHFRGLKLEWPKFDEDVQNAIGCNATTGKCLYEVGYFCVVRRFSSKEEYHRVMASLVDPAVFPEATKIGLENHLNVFHVNKRGLPEDIARGLTIFLNSTIVDKQFRIFNGHTQVNATDLRSIKYPSRRQLERLGKFAKNKVMDQNLIDRLVGELSNDGYA